MNSEAIRLFVERATTVVPRFKPALRTELGGKAFTEAWSEGRAMTLEQAARYALDEDASVR